MLRILSAAFYKFLERKATMGLSVLHILEAVLLGGNAMAILNEKRFLRKCMICSP